MKFLIRPIAIPYGIIMCDPVNLHAPMNFCLTECEKEKGTAVVVAFAKGAVKNAPDNVSMIALLTYRQ